jgi:hypothetical protein
MLSNLIGETVSHRARFAGLGLALAATIALLVAPSFRGAGSVAEPGRAELMQAERNQYRTHRCRKMTLPSHAPVAADRELDVRRAEHEARQAERSARRAEHEARQAERDAARAARRALRDAMREEARAQRELERIRREALQHDRFE